MTRFRSLQLGSAHGRSILHAHLDPSLRSTRVAPLHCDTRLQNLVRCEAFASVDGTYSS